MKIPNQAYTAEFNALAVTRVKDGLTAGAAAKELGLIEQTLRNWVKAAAAGRLSGAGAKMVTPEQMEQSRLRAENMRLKRENETLKKATAYVATEVSSKKWTPSTYTERAGGVRWNRYRGSSIRRSSESRPCG
jgi:transposase